ncbi:MAG: histone deacetylase [Chloroflexota bacterium]
MSTIEGLACPHVSPSKIGGVPSPQDHQASCLVVAFNRRVFNSKQRYNNKMKTDYVLVTSPGHIYPGHPEDPGRLSLLGDWESKPYANSLQRIEPEAANVEQITAVHAPQMVAALRSACQRGPGIIDYAPTYVTQTSFDDALLAAGSSLACTRRILEGQARNGFAIVRPPGHHAEPGAPMGFCLFNNIAIAAKAALAHGLERVLIVDFDAHHGNGTEAAFLVDERVAYFSTHQEYIYPGTGGLQSVASARGRIVNLPLPSRSGDAAFAIIAEEVLLPFVNRFQPEMIFVSAGFDSHWDDPLTSLGLSSTGFYQFSMQLVELARRHCAGKLLFALEGGYNPANIAAGIDAVMSALTGAEHIPADDPSPHGEPDIRSRLDTLRDWHGL